MPPAPAYDTGLGVRPAGQVEPRPRGSLPSRPTCRARWTQLVVDQLAVAHQAVAHRRRGGVDDRVAGVDDDRDRAEHRQHLADPAGAAVARSVPARRCARTIAMTSTATAPMTRPTAPPRVAASVGSTRFRVRPRDESPAWPPAGRGRHPPEVHLGGASGSPGCHSAASGVVRSRHDHHPPHRRNPVMRKAFHEELERGRPDPRRDDPPGVLGDDSRDDGPARRRHPPRGLRSSPPMPRSTPAGPSSTSCRSTCSPASSRSPPTCASS